VAKSTGKKPAAKPAAPPPAPAVPAIEIQRIGTETLYVPIIGTAPLVVHRFSEKAKRKMLDEMQGRKHPKEPKNPQEEYEAAFHRLKDGRPAFPALGFKAATVSGARFYGKKQISMTAVRQICFFSGEPGPDGHQYIAIEGEATMREDTVTVGQGGTDLRYRPQFTEWRARIEVTYVTSMITRESILSLIDAGGFGVGVGEWRPERNGDFGTYMIDPSRKVEVVKR
jgi:hypothetical protein